MHPKVSIVVPVYKAEKFLERCISSIAHQTYTNLEIILVDDGSPDNCPQICDEWAKKDVRIRVIHKPNEGVSIARNVGIENATGEYVMFVDSDDELLPQAVELCYPDDTCDLVIFDYEMREGIRKSIIRAFEEKTASVMSMNDVISIACCDGLNSAWARLYRRELLRDHGLRFPTDMIMAEDAAFVFSVILEAKSIRYIPCVGYRYHHAFSTGDSRLLRAPNVVMSNLVHLYYLRASALQGKKDKLGILKEELDELCVKAEASLVRSVFEAKGSLLIRGIQLQDTSGVLLSLSKEFYDKHGAFFSPLIRMKCFLLKEDWRIFIQIYAWLREIYIRIRK